MDGLQERVEKFELMQLPGQPMGMHMGTFNLVNDLWREVRRLRDIIRSCVHGAEAVDIGGECIGLYRPNKHCMKDSPTPQETASE